MIANRKAVGKRPKLFEAAEYYEIPFDESRTHTSIYDAEITAKIFASMLTR